MILSDLYKPHDREELEPEASYGVWWYGRDATKRTGNLTATGGPARRFGRRPEEALIAVPVVDAGVPKEWVGAAREAIRYNVRSASAGRRLWELSGGVGYCACGRRLSTHTNAGRAGRRPQYHYVCSHRRRHGSGACPHAKFHKAEEIEGRVRAFVYRLLHDPEALRRQVLTSLELDRVSLGRVEEEAGVLLEQIAEADRERDGYLRLAAKGRISDGKLHGYLAELEQRKDGATRELGGLRERRERRERLQKLDELAREVDAHLADLPHLIDRTPVIREHETAPPKRGEDGSLPIYLLNPERMRERTTEEIAELREQRDRERAERYRWAYGLLGLRVVASKDGTLELTWRAGSEIL